MRKEEFEYNGYKATVLFPDNFNGKWVWKTEFFYAFDQAEQELFSKGYARVYYEIGYPFLDEDLKAEMPIIKSEGLTEYARSRKNSQLLITPPADGGEEEVFYNYLADGRVKLKNEKIGVTCEIRYGTDDFPVTLQWKSMISGDYALGIEPSVTRFDDFQMRSLPPRGKRLYRIDILFDEAGEIFPQKDKAVSV